MSLNQELSEEWYSEKNKKKNQMKDIYYADSCTISRNYHQTEQNKNSKNNNIYFFILYRCHKNIR